MLENPRRGREARSFTTNVPKILDLKSSYEQIFSKNGQYKTWTADCGLGIKYGLGIKCGLRTEYKTRTRYKTRTTDYVYKNSFRR